MSVVTMFYPQKANTASILSGVALLMAMCGMSFASPSPSIVPTLAPYERKSVSVEYVYRYKLARYQAPKPIPLDGDSSRESDAPETVLLNYFNELKAGRVEAALGYWETRSIPLIKKMFGDMSDPDVRAAVIDSNASDWAVFTHRIDYEGFVIVGVARGKGPVPAADKLVSFEYVLKSNSGAWQLTQELADNPVYCCRDAPGGRHVRPGKSKDGEFQRLLDSLNR